MTHSAAHCTCARTSHPRVFFFFPPPQFNFLWNSFIVSANTSTYSHLDKNCTAPNFPSLSEWSLYGEWYVWFVMALDSFWREQKNISETPPPPTSSSVKQINLCKWEMRGSHVLKAMFWTEEKVNGQKILPSSSSVFCFRFFLDFEFFFSFSSCCSSMNRVTMKQRE